MKEDFLHYVWKFRKFNTQNLKTVRGKEVVLIDHGLQNYNSGPDFFNCRIILDGQNWAGNIEIHTKASNWFLHNHQKDENYDSIILHVVWEFDKEIYRNNGEIIPTIELNNKVDHSILSNYRRLFSKPKNWINCQNEISNVNPFIVDSFLERLFIQRLESRSATINNELKTTNFHWEVVFFRLLCKSFGSKINADSFLSVARSLDFSKIKSLCNNENDLEAVLMGQAGLLNVETDMYSADLNRSYQFIKHKFGLSDKGIIRPKFFRLRPANFPTIRFAQLAALYSQRTNIFAEIILARDLEEFYQLLKVNLNAYWDSHYRFGNLTKKRSKTVSKAFMNTLIINCIIPLKFAFARSTGNYEIDHLLKLVTSLSAESNSIVKKYNDLGLRISSAVQSQGLLELKSEYCNKHRCLECAIGNYVLKQKK